jgi:hypothetical protein
VFVILDCGMHFVKIDFELIADHSKARPLRGG